MKRYFVYMFMLVIFFLGYMLTAQENTLDSLKKALKDVTNDTVRCNILSAIIEQEPDDRVWPYYNEQLLRISETGIRSVKSEGLKKFYKKCKAYALNNKGVLANTNGNTQKALQFYLAGIEIQKEINDKIGLAASFNNIGFVYNHRGDIAKAMEYYHYCLKISEETGNKIGISTSLNNLGMIYVGQEDIHKGVDYYKRSLKVCREIGDVDGEAYALNNLGSAYDCLNDMTQAIGYYKKSLEIYNVIGDKRGIATVLNNIGMVHHNDFNLEEALDYYKRAIAIEEEAGDLPAVAYTSANIANIRLKQGQMEEAIKYAFKSLNLGKALGYPDNIHRPAQILKLIYYKQGNYEKALEMFKLEIQMHDSIENKETKKASIKKQFEYEYGKKAAQDSILHAEEQKIRTAQLNEQAARIKQEKTQRFVLYGGLSMVLVFAGFVYNRFIVARKQKLIIEVQKTEVDLAYEKLNEKNKEVLDSINYARRIQNSLLPTEKYMARVLNRIRT